MSQSRFSGPIKLTGTKGGLQFLQANAATPTSSSVLELYRSGTDVYWWNGTAGSKLNSQGGGTGSDTLDSAYENGRAVTLDQGAIVFTDATAAAANSIEFVKSGAGTGNILDFAINTTFTGNVIDIDMNAGVGAKAIYIDGGAAIRTADLIDVKHDGSGNTDVMNITATNTGTGAVFDINMDGDGSNAGVFNVDMNAAVNAEFLYLDVGAGARAANLIEIKYDGSGAVDMFAIVATDTSSGHIFDIDMGGTHTGDVVNIDLDAAVAARALYIDSGAGTRTVDEIVVLHEGDGNIDVMSIVSTNTGTGSIFDINMDGAGSTSGVFNVDMNAAVGAEFLYLDVGAGIRTANLIEIKYDGSGAVDCFAILGTDTSSGHIFDIDMAGIHTGDVFNTDMDAAVGARYSYVDAGAGIRTVSLYQTKFDGSGNVACYDIDVTNTGSGAIIDIDVDAAHTGSAIAITYGTSAATGDAILITTGTNLAGAALKIAATGARTDSLIDIQSDATDAGTDDYTFYVKQSGQQDSSMFKLVYDTAASTGDCLDITMGTNVAGSALVISSTGIRTDDLIKIDDDSTGNSQIFDINLSGIYTGNVLDIAYSVAAVTGSMFKGVLGTGVGAMAFEVTGTGVRTADVFDYTSDQTGSALIFDINLTGAASGNVFDVTFSSGAYSGNVLDINMGTNVAGDAINIASAGTGDGCVLDVAHTGNLASGNAAVKIVSTGSPAGADGNLVELVQSTGAGTAGNNVLYISATGTNVEALNIAAGLFFQSVATATPGAGNDETLPSSSNVVHYDPNGASRTGVIVTAGLRDGQKLTICNIADAAETVTMAAAVTSNVAFGTSCVIARYQAVELTWNAATALWYQNVVV